MKRLHYFFEEITNCEMCGDDIRSHKILGQRLNTSQGRRPQRKSGITVRVKQCTKCQLIYSSPQPVPFNIQDHYGIPPEDYWRPEYFDFSPEYFSKEIGAAKRILNFQNGMKALDIGAGIGKCMIALEKAGFNVLGFEPSAPFYERAISTMGIDPARIKLGMIENVDYNDNSFDFISFGAVFEHLYHPAECLQKALHWLKPNGVIHIEVPSSKYLLAKLANRYYRLMGTNYVTNISPMHNPFHLYEFSRRSFEELGKKLHYKIDFVQYYVCENMLLPKIFNGVLNWYMKKTNTGMQLVVWLKKE
ncbi:MAG: methyltransferase domain-containing protein [Chitinophagales bacterium]